jgi:CSLREA domain-containing protein
MAPSAQAATITVSTTSDEIGADGVCSLREAVIAANSDTAGPGNDCTAGNGADTVSVPGGVYKLSIAKTGTDDAASGDLNITQPATLSGAGAASTQVDGRGIDRVFAVGATGVQISGLTITGGDAGPNGTGGGIFVLSGGSLTLKASIVTANEAIEGGGIASRGQATISDSTISHNDGTSGGGGVYNDTVETMLIERTQILSNTAQRAGGVFENGGKLTIMGGSVSDNGSAATTAQGGGLEIDGGPTTLTDVQVSGNVANNVGAGIDSDARPAEETTLAGTEVSGNELVSFGNLVRGAGIYASGAITLTNSWVHDNSGLNGEGGGIFFMPRAAEEPLQIEGSTIGPSNRATEGDGIFADGAAVAITRSTIAGNGDDLYPGYGGGLYVASGTAATLRDDTLAENKASNSTGGGNLYAGYNSTLLWQNTLVARPFGGGNCEHGSTASITSEGGDQEYGDPELMCGFTHAGDIASSADLDTTQLGALQNNGGPTETMALLPGAAPVDTGAGCRPIDQRGVPRPQGSACDSGAYELDTMPPVVSITSGPSGTTSTRVVSFTFAADEPSLLECELDGASFAPCSSPFTSESLSDGPHTFFVRATDIAGSMGAAISRTFTIAPGASESPGGSESTGSSGPKSKLEPEAPEAPKITHVSQTARRWRLGRTLPHLARALVSIGTRFSFTLDQPAQVLYLFTRTLRGRRVNGKCVRQDALNRHMSRCKRSVTAARLSLPGQAGHNCLHFEGPVTPKLSLAPGSYSLIITATAEGRRSSPAILHFTILPPLISAPHASG